MSPWGQGFQVRARAQLLTPQARQSCRVRKVVMPEQAVRVVKARRALRVSQPANLKLAWSLMKVALKVVINRLS